MTECERMTQVRAHTCPVDVHIDFYENLLDSVGSFGVTWLRGKLMKKSSQSTEKKYNEQLRQALPPVE